MTEAHVNLKGVTRLFDRDAGQEPLHALGPIDIELRAGEFFGVVGPSGCGKSTLLDVIAGLTQASAGDIVIDGKPVQGNVPDGVGVVFQEDASFPWLDVWNNIAFGLRRMGLGHAETERRVSAALGLMGLTDFARAYPAQLSGGMRQRV